MSARRAKGVAIAVVGLMVFASLVVFDIPGKVGSNGAKHEASPLSIPVDGVYLSEDFSSWATLNTSWKVFNGTAYCTSPHPGGGYWWEPYCTFDLAEGALEFIPGYLNFNTYILSDIEGMMNWTQSVVYEKTLAVTFGVYVPYTPRLGQDVNVSLYDGGGQLGIKTRIMLPTSATGLSQWLVDNGGSQSPICQIGVGWHNMSIVMTKGDASWTAYCDGIKMEQLPFVSPTTQGFDVSKVQIVNSLVLYSSGYSAPFKMDYIQVLALDSFVPGKTAPSAVFTAQPSYGGQSTVFTVDASASWDVETPSSELMLRWDWESDGQFDTGYSTQKTAQNTFASGGSKSITLEVMDADGMTSRTSRTIVVDDVAPVADFKIGFILGEAYTNVWVNPGPSFDALVPSSALYVRFDFGDGSWTNWLPWADTQVAWHQYFRTGEVIITIEVRDPGGLISSCSKPFLVDRDPPVADAGPTIYTDPGVQYVTFDASGSSDNDRIWYYTWVVYDDGVAVWGDSSFDPVTTCLLDFLAAGFSYEVKLTVLDPTGNSDVDYTMLKVSGRLDRIAPVADAGPAIFLIEGASQFVLFDGGGSTDNVGIVSYVWTFRIGGWDYLFTTTSPVTMYYLDVWIYSGDSFLVTLTVKDAAGNSAIDTTTMSAKHVTTLPTILIEKGLGPSNPYAWTVGPGYTGRWTCTLSNDGLKTAVLTIKDVSYGGSWTMVHVVLNFRKMGGYPAGEIYFDSGVYISSYETFEFTISEMDGPVGSTLTVHQMVA